MEHVPWNDAMQRMRKWVIIITTIAVVRHSFKATSRIRHDGVGSGIRRESQVKMCGSFDVGSVGSLDERNKT